MRPILRRLCRSSIRGDLEAASAKNRVHFSACCSRTVSCTPIVPSHRAVPEVVPVILGRLALAVLPDLRDRCRPDLGWKSLAIPNRLRSFHAAACGRQCQLADALLLAALERDRSRCLRRVGGFAHRAQVGAGSARRSRAALNAGRGFEDIRRSRADDLPRHRARSRWRLALFETNVLRPAARQRFRSGRGAGTHTRHLCVSRTSITVQKAGAASTRRPMLHRPLPVCSCRSGQQITLKDDWAGSNVRRSEFLRALRDGACDFFDVVPSLDYNEGSTRSFSFRHGILPDVPVSVDGSGRCGTGRSDQTS